MCVSLKKSLHSPLLYLRYVRGISTVPLGYVRKVSRQGMDVNFGLILGAIFGTIGVFILLLLIVLGIRKHQLIKKRNKLMVRN